MISQFLTENFKGFQSLDLPLRPLTVLAGMNGAGKSTLLQALLAVRQSHLDSPRGEHLLLNGTLVSLGQGGDVLFEAATSEDISISVMVDDTSYRWVAKAVTSSNQLKFTEKPSTPPTDLISANFQFLGADRMVPQTIYRQAHQSARESGFLGTRGENTVDFLAGAILTGKPSVPASRHCPNEGIGLSASALATILAAPERLDSQVSGWLQQISPGVRVDAILLPGTDEAQLKYTVLSDTGTSRDFRPTNVGFGVTYSLPIVAACLAAPAGALLLLENPEAHLHPHGQAALGRLMAQCAADGVQIICETHSDHILNAVRLAVKQKVLQPEDIAIHFFRRRSGKATVESPEVDVSGRLSNWPLGFFDQWDRDLDQLLE